MKTTKKTLFIGLVVINSITSIAWAQSKKAAVMPLDSKGLILDAQQLGNLLRVELEKTSAYQVIDRYETKNALDEAQIKLDDCYGKTCLVKAGKALHVDKVIAGSVERYNEKILITLRTIDVNTAAIEKTQVNEFLNLQPEIQSMLSITLNNMLGLKNNEELENRLTKLHNFESTTNNPGIKKVSLAGPRMGFTFLSGKDGQRLASGKDEGGYDALPFMTQFGYQFETQYLNSGNFQALFEAIPMITGIDQGYFIPSIAILNGLRNNKHGLEFAFGPVLGFMKKSDGYFDNNGSWHLKSDWDGTGAQPKFVEMMDRRGDTQFTSGFLMAIGKTFKSGALNIPVNLYVIPGKQGTRVGISMGFNIRK